VLLSRNLETLTPWNSLGLSRPVMGLLYLTYFKSILWLVSLLNILWLLTILYLKRACYNI